MSLPAQSSVAVSPVVVISRAQRKSSTGFLRARITAGGMLLVSALLLCARSRTQTPVPRPREMAVEKSFIPLPQLPPLSQASSQLGPSALSSDATPLEVGWQDLPKIKPLAFDSKSGPLPIFSDNDAEGTTITRNGGALKFRPPQPPAMPSLSWHSKTDDVAQQESKAENERMVLAKWQRFERDRLLHPHHPPAFPNLANPATPAGTSTGGSSQSMASMSGNQSPGPACEPCAASPYPLAVRFSALMKSFCRRLLLR